MCWFKHRLFEAVWLTAFLSIVAALLLLPNPTHAQSSIVVYVDPAGNDSNDGVTPSSALASLALAIAHAAERDRKLVPDVGKDSGVPIPVVQLAAGKFHLAKAIVLTSVHSGRPGRPILVRGADSGATVITGAWPAGTPRSVSDPAVRSRLPPNAINSVQVYDLAKAKNLPPSSIAGNKASATADVPQLQVQFRGRLYDSARWPDQGYAQLKAVEPDRDSPTFATGRSISNWVGESDLLTCGFFGPQYYDECIPIDIVDAEKGIVQLKRRPAYGLRSDRRFAVFNAVSELNRPGEWWFDSKNQRLYFWTPVSPAADDVEVSVAENIIYSSGTHNLRFDNLSIEGARGDGLVFVNVNDITFDHLLIRNMGSRGIVINGRNVVLRNCTIYATGMGAIDLSGGDFRTLTPSGNVVEKCLLYDFNRRINSGRGAGISMQGVGHKVVGNEITDSGGYGIMSGAAEIEIAENRLSHLAYNLGDGSAIYIGGRDWTHRGVVVRNNIIYDIQNVTDETNKGILLDDMASGDYVFENAFLRVTSPIFIGGGRENVIERNIFVDSSPAFHIDNRGERGMRSYWEPADGKMRRQLEAAISEIWPHIQRYPSLTQILADRPGSPANNIFKDNILIDSAFGALAPDILAMQKFSGTLDDKDVVLTRGLIPFLATPRPSMSDFVVKVRPQMQGHISPPAIWLSPR
jgi:hypothetical protein